MSGSSARKLKYGGANLLAGRAFVYLLFPFCYLELGDKFNLNEALRWGLLPKIRFLQSYTYTYLKVSAQSNGKIINYANIARDVGVDNKKI